MRTLCFIGSALTFGSGDREALGWCGRLTRQLLRERRAEQHYNLGLPGDTMPELARRAERECRARLEGRGTALLVIEPGMVDLAILSDGTRRTDATTYEAYVRTVLTTLGALGPTVLIGPTPVLEAAMPLKDPLTGDDLRYSNAAIGGAARRLAEIAMETGAAYLDLFSMLRNAPAWDAAIEEDGLTPSTNGHKMIADLLHPDFARLLEQFDG